MVSEHYKKDRYKREYIINHFLNGDGNVIENFVINNRVYNITDTGLIIILGKNGEVITKLIARPKQIERYYKRLGRNPPKWLVDLSKWHMAQRYNK